MDVHKYKVGNVVYTKPGFNNHIMDEYFAGSGYASNLKGTIVSASRNLNDNIYYIIQDENNKKRVIFEVCLMDIAERRDYLIENLIK